MTSVLAQLKEYNENHCVPTGHDRVEIENGFRKKQIQKLYTKRYADGTVTRSLRWETVKEVQS